jgi:phage shock protein PspC (stress-responsive transcriptional regulator)
MNNFHKSKTDKKIAGVFGGLAETWHVDPLWMRIGAVVLCFTGVGILPVVAGYATAAWLLPFGED